MSAEKSNSKVLSTAQSHRKVLETAALICRDRSANQGGARVFLGGDWDSEAGTWLHAQVAALPKCELIRVLGENVRAASLDVAVLTGTDFVAANLPQVTSRLKPEGVLVLEFAAKVPGHSTSEWKQRLASAGYLAIAARSDRATGITEREIIKATRGKEPVAAPARAASASTQNLPRLRQIVASILGELLQIPAGELDHTAAFTEFGMDSIGAVAFAKGLNRELGVELKPTILFDYGSIGKLAAFLATQVDLAPATPEPAPQVSPQPATPAAVSTRPVTPGAPTPVALAIIDTDIAVIGMSGRFPEAETTEEFWRNLASGRNSITEVPEERWHHSRFYNPQATTKNQTKFKWGGFLTHADKFDPLFFNISGREAEVTDPQQRVFLEECYHALEDGGYAGAALGSALKCGVFAGVEPGDYLSLVMGHEGRENPALFQGNADSILAARISYFLDLKGPSIAVNTACSSSLVAIHLACRSLITKDCDLALSGGVRVYASEKGYLALGNMGMLSAEGQCKTFDAGADGFVPGEAVGVVLLKRLSDAVRDGDRILGVIKGSAINQDGKTNGITAPSSLSQTDVQVEVYEKAGINPRSIQYVEAHGTGTKLGDPIEIEALTRSFRRFTTDKQFCAIASLKTNIGHTMAAAGVCSLIKVLLALKHQKIPPSLNHKLANPYIDFPTSPFSVSTALSEWRTEPGQPRRACINSFGFSGTNCHVLVEEAPPLAPSRNGLKPAYLVALSGKTPEALRARIHDLREWLKQSSASMGDLSFTLTTGRAHFEHRIALVASSPDELRRALEQLPVPEVSAATSATRKPKSGGESAEAALYRQVLETLQKELTTITDAGVYREKLSALAALYGKGYELDWELLHQGEEPRRISLPGYPFARESYWSKATTVPPAVVRGPLHPLVQRDSSTAGEIQFASDLNPDAFYLSDHRIQGERVLPGVAYLEMATVAISRLLGTPAIQLNNVVWLRPLRTTGAVAVKIRLFKEGDSFRFEIVSGAPEIMHAQGSGQLRQGIAPARVDLAAIKVRCQSRYDATSIYAECAKAGLQLGEGFRTIREIQSSETEVLARLQLADGMLSEAGIFSLHPGLMDGALQATAVLVGRDWGGLPVPHSVGEVIGGKLPSACFAHVVALSLEPNLRKFQVTLLSESGEVLVQLKNFAMRPLRAALPESSLVVLKPVWSATEATPVNPVQGKLLLLDGPSLLAGQIRKLALGLEVIEGQGTAVDVEQSITSTGADYIIQWANPTLATGSIVESGIIPVFQLARALVRRGGSKRVSWLFVHPPQADPAWAAVHGLARGLVHEKPNVILRTLEAVSPTAAQLLSELGAGSRVEEARLGAEGRFVKGLEAVTQPARTGSRMRTQGVYFITGGLGGLGLILSRYLAQQYQARLVITGRSKLDDTKQAALREIEQAGGQALYVAADVGSHAEMQEALRQARERFDVIHGVIHAAGVLQDGFLLQKEPASIRSVLSPKMDGTRILDELTRPDSLDFFLLFSSLSAVLGNVGQTDYGYANAFLDEFARWREHEKVQGRRSGSTLAINWPFWQSGGMRENEAVVAAKLAEAGLALLPTATGLQLLETSLLGSETQVIALYGNEQKIRSLVSPPERRPEAPAPRSAPVKAGDLRGRLLPYLTDAFAELVKIPAARIKAAEPLEKYGIDSIMVMEFTQRLEKDFGSLSKTLLFEHQTLDELAGFFLENHGARLGELFPVETVTPIATQVVAPPIPVPVKETVSSRETPGVPAPISLPAPAPTPLAVEAGDIAIIGVFGRFPMADDLEQFWANLRTGRDCIQEIPRERWDYRIFYDPEPGKLGKTRNKWGGFLNGVDRFDAQFFAVTPREAVALDPQERIFLESVWRTVEDAGYRRQDLSGRKVGVYVGVMYGEYQLYGAGNVEEGRVYPISSFYSSIANRVSYFFNWHGPSLAVDTMCSSSLTAMHLACESLRRGESEVAIAGGVNTTLHPHKDMLLSPGGFAASDGRCRSFGEGGDGYIHGEGVGAVMLKPLARAQADGDHIYAVIKASSINHGGKTNGYTVPNPKAQAELIREALRQGNIDPQTVTYVEAHGTGTPLGDPIEISALAKAFQDIGGKDNLAPRYCAVGSVKSNIGHLESAAGIAAVAKVLLQMKHGQIAPSLHSSKLNPNIPFAGSPFRVPQTLEEWPSRNEADQTLPRRAGISSFGAGGANAHLILEEYVAAPVAPQNAAPVLIVLSAKSPDRLQARAAQLRDFLTTEPSVALADVAFTLQTGREPMEERLAFVAGDKDQAIACLSRFLKQENGGGLFSGKVRHEGDATPWLGAEEKAGILESLIRQRKWESLAQYWVGGGEVDWQLLNAPESARRIALPSYPFAGERYWAPDQIRAATKAQPVSKPADDGPALEAVTYRPIWQTAPLPVIPAGGFKGKLLLFDAQSTLEMELKSRFPELEVKRVSTWNSKLDYLALLEAATPNFIVHHLDASITDLGVALEQGVHSVFPLARALLSRPLAGEVRWLGVQSGGSQPAFDALAGFAKSLNQEQPRIRFHQVLADQVNADVLAELFNPEGAQEVRRLGGRREVRSLESIRVEPTGALPLERNGVYLITGGLGGLGKMFAGHLASVYQARLVLVGRSEPSADQRETLAGWESSGAKVVYVRGDVGNGDDMRRVVGEARQHFGPISGVLHTAGVLRDSFLLKKQGESFAEVLRPKVQGTVAIEEACSNEPLQFVALFSSTSGLLGNAGQTDYAYANAFMDAFARQREAKRLHGSARGRTVSINWPLWQEGGMRIAGKSAETFLNQLGLYPLPTDAGLNLFANALRGSEAQVMPLWGVKEKILQTFRPAPVAQPIAVATPVPLNGLSQSELAGKIEEYLKGVLCGITQLPVDKFDSLQRFEEMGIDSIIVGEFNTKLASEIGALPKTLLFEFPNLREVARNLAASQSQLFLPRFGSAVVDSPASIAGQVQSAPVVLPSIPAQPAASSPEPDTIAIIGVAGRYPSARNLDEFWGNLKAGKDCITEVPKDRWDADKFFDADPNKAAEGKIYCRHGAFIDDVDKFDPLFFGIAPVEADLMDPQERLFLETAWHVLEDAGHTRADLASWRRGEFSANVGVFVGVTTNTYNSVARDNGGERHLPTTLPWSLANRVSYLFNFNGPSLPVDTACSSSLSAIHLACQAIQNGECQQAIAGGVNLYLHPAKYVSLCMMRMLSPEGKCRSFGEGGSGFGPGEGVGAVLLKPLKLAIQDGDRIYAVIKGTAVNHGGRTNGYTVPNPQAHAELIKQAVRNAKIDSGSISYIEAHGTGTSLGDPIEIDGLTRAFQGETPRIAPCAIGSVKSNIGHLEAAAGIAGLTKILLQMRHGQLAPSLHADKLNPNINFDRTPLRVQRQLGPWLAGTTPRRAGISSFGAGGTNAHVIVEEYPFTLAKPRAAAPVLFVLSAKNAAQLKVSARGLEQFIAAGKNGEIDFASVAYTLQVGREALEERVSFVAGQREELLARLRQIAEGAPNDGVLAGRVKRETDSGSEPLRFEPASWNQAATAWIQGRTVDWRSLWGGELPSRISLPGYPFARHRHWIPVLPDVGGQGAQPRLHPLLHRNDSTFGRQAYSSHFDGTDVALNDHQISGESVLPGAATLEMALAAVRLASGQETVRLQNVVWLRPLRATDRKLESALTLQQEPEGGIRFEITTRADGTHVQGKAILGQPFVSERVDLIALRSRCRQSLNPAELYQGFESRGMKYGPAFQVIRELQFGPGEALTRLEVPAAWEGQTLSLHPALVDGTLQSLAVLGAGDGGLEVPFAVGEVECSTALPRVCYGYARATGGQGMTRYYEIKLLSESGEVLARLNQLSVRRYAREEGELLFLQPVWESAPLSSLPAAISGTVLLFDGAEALAALPEQPGLRVIHVQSGERYEVTGSTIRVRVNQAEDYERLLSEAKPDYLVYGWASPVAPASQTLARGLYSVHCLAQAALKQRLSQPLNFLFVHRHGEAASEAVAGYGKSWAQESTRVRWKSIGVDDSITLSVQELSAPGVEVRYGAKGREVRNLAEPSGSLPNVPLKDSGVYLITGGAGGLGRIFAEELSRKYKAKLLLVGRSELSSDKLAWVKELGATYMRADVSTQEGAQAVAHLARAMFGRVDWVLHAAGETRDALIANKSLADMERVIAAKVGGALALDEALKDEKLEGVVLFSSTAGLLGNAGQSDYAYANAWLDAFARERELLRQQGRRHGRTLSLNWPLWEAGGMKSNAQTKQAHAERLGISALPTAAGLSAFERMLKLEGAQCAVFHGNATMIKQALGLTPVTTPTQPLAVVQSAVPPVPVNGKGHEESLMADLKRLVAKVLRLDVEVLEADVDMSEYGFDSITLTTLSNEVNSTFGFEITPATLFEYTTLQSFTAYLAHSQAAKLQARYGVPMPVETPKPVAVTVPIVAIVPPPVVRPVPQQPRVVNSMVTREPVAIVGMSGMFPGSPDLEAFWKNLEAGADLIGKAPTERWDFSSMGNGPLPSLNMASPWGGFLADVDKFDPLFFDISPREAALMDPQQRVFLQTVWKAIEDSGHKAADFAGTKTGLFVGVAANDYASLLAFGGVEVEAYSSTGNAHSVLANRVSYFFDLRGPSEAIDTACSSSLVAIHRAIESLQCGSSEMAIVGGVNVLLSPGAFLSFNKAGMLCEDGRCKTFDESANGYVRGEGVGALVLKPLSRAQQDGDHIYGVIAGSAENHGGHVQSLTVPNPNAQAQLIQEACARAGIDPHTISYIEAHGTGTPLGDPIEINGLKKAFGENRSGIAKPRCAVASVKTNIGHLETAAGIAGIIKVLLALKHRRIPGNVHLRKINPYIQVEGTPFYFPQSAETWETPVDQTGYPVPRRAGVSSFGFGGANAHIIIEEFVASVPQAVGGSPQNELIVLSARNQDRLKELAGGLLNYLEQESGCTLADLAFTLQAGRTDMDERLAFVAADVSEVTARLSGYLKGPAGGTEVETGNAGNQKAALALLRQVHEDDDYLRPLLAARNLRKLARLWVAGVEVPWEQAWTGLVPRRLSLPTYPFARDSYWVPKGAKPGVTQSGTQRLHPLLHRNESTLQEQRYATDLGAEEIILAHHQVAGTRILPGAASLEMAFAGLVLAAGTPEVEIRDLTWLRPFVGGDSPLQIALAIHPGPEGVLQFEIRNAAGVVHVNGSASLGVPFVAEQIESQAIKARCPQIVAPADLYARLRADGLEYGPGFQAIKAVQHSADEAWSELEVPAIWVPGYRLHPALVDAAWQSVSLISSVRGEKRLPFAVERVECGGELPTCCFAYAKRTTSGEGTDRYDLKLVDAAGHVVVRIHGYTLRPLEKPSTDITYYAPVWESSPLADHAETLSGTLLWFGRSGSESIAAPAGMKLVRVLPGNAYASTGDTIVIRADRAEDYERLFTEAQTKAVVHAWASRELSVDDAARLGINSLHLATRALLKRGGQESMRLVLVHPPGASLFEGVGGYLKSAGFEQPLLQWKTIATEPNEVDWSRELPAGGGVEIRYLRGERQVRSLAETAPAQKHPGISHGEVCMITGGAGGLGRIFAEHLVQEHAANLVLVGRSELTGERREWVERLGAKYVQADLSTKAGAESVVEFARRSFGRVDWVLHAAGELRDGLIWNKPVSDLEAVVRSKVRSALFLDEALGAAPLKGYILFSSIAGLFGNAGQADYAYANACLDALARARETLRSEGKRHGLTVSINWALWKSGGMKSAKPGRGANAGGPAPLETEDGLRIFAAALQSGLTQICAFAGSPGAIPTREVLAITHVPVTKVASVSGETEDLMAYLIQEFSALTKVPLTQIKPEEALEKYGFDSIMALEFSGKLEQRYGPLSKTLLFEHQTLASLAGYLAQRAPIGTVAKSSPVMPAPIARPLPATRFASSIKAESKTDDIAIIGLSGRYPQAETLDDFWANLVAGKDCVQEIPAERWNNQVYFEPGAPKPGKSNNRFGGFIKDFDKFDALFFNISPREAEVMDPQERLFLETVWNTVEDAGYSKSALDGQDIGVFVGVMYGQYQLFGPEESLRRGEITTLSSSYASIANRVSYYFNWHGPSGAMDSMCSSSLVSIHLACESLKRGESRLAIAGGVNVILHPHKDVGLSQAGFLNPEGKSRSFGKSGARGYVPGEGVGAVLLKPLAQAIQDGDHIYGVIKASAVNHSGKTNGYAVPNPQAQADLVSRALKNAGITADSISYVEAAATGSSLGDAMEIGALTKAFQAAGGANRPCAIGSVKSNIGHLESASGMAGLTKVLLQMRHQQLVPSIHAEELSDTIAWNETPFHVQRAVADWASLATNGRSGPRRASINAFGAGGTNAHLIVEEFDAGPRPPAGNLPGVIVLSARDRERLVERAGQLLKYLRNTGGQEGLPDIAYTLQVGREPMAERLAFLANDIAGAINKIEQFVAGNQRPVDMWSGNSLKQNGPVTFNYQDLANLAEAWVRGGQVDWTKLHAGVRRRRLALPGYPFARERHWFRDAAPVADSPASEAKPKDVELLPVTRFATTNVPEQVKLILGKLLKLPLDRLDDSQPMTDYGLDSMTAITFLDHLERAMDVQLEPSDLIECPTLQALCARITRKYPLLPAALVTTNGNGHHPKTNVRNGTNGQSHVVELGESRSSAALTEKKTPRTLALAPMDYAFVGAGRLPMQVLYYFEHKLDFAALRRALNQLGQMCFPLNSRLVKRGFRKLTMREGRDEPDFLEVTCEPGVRPPAHDQPATLEPFKVEFQPENPEQKLAKFRLFQLERGSVLSVNVSHVIADGFSFYYLLSAWAALARGEDVPRPELRRTVLNRLMAKFRSGPLSIPSTPPTEAGHGGAGLAARFESLLIDPVALLAEARAEAAPGLRDKLTENSVITAHVWKRYAEALPPDTSELRLSCPIDFRRHCPSLAATYFGNAVYPAQTSCSRAEVIGLSLPELAAKIHDTIRASDESAFLRYQADLDKVRRRGGVAAVARAALLAPRGGLVVTNVSRFPHPPLDFGSGTFAREVSPVNYAGTAIVVSAPGGKLKVRLSYGEAANSRPANGSHAVIQSN